MKPQEKEPFYCGVLHRKTWQGLTSVSGWLAGDENIIWSDGPDSEGRSDSMAMVTFSFYFIWASARRCQSTFERRQRVAATKLMTKIIRGTWGPWELGGFIRLTDGRPPNWVYVGKQHRRPSNDARGFRTYWMTCASQQSITTIGQGYKTTMNGISKREVSRRKLAENIADGPEASICVKSIDREFNNSCVYALVIHVETTRGCLCTFKVTSSVP